MQYLIIKKLGALGMLIIENMGMIDSYSNTYACEVMWGMFI